jgi:hypothetical protein
LVSGWLGRVAAWCSAFYATVLLECLGRHWFLDLDDARENVEKWRAEYNEVETPSYSDLCLRDSSCEAAISAHA